KIHHEHRTLFVDGRRISPASEGLLRELARKWGGDETSLTYYGSVDATPLFVRLVARYCATHGESILADRVTRRDGGQVTVRESVLAAVNWIASKMDASPLGLVEFQRRNPQGIPFQVWKDSNTSYVHRDGTGPRRRRPGEMDREHRVKRCPAAGHRPVRRTSNCRSIRGRLSAPDLQP